MTHYNTLNKKLTNKLTWKLNKLTSGINNAKTL